MNAHGKGGIWRWPTLWGLYLLLAGELNQVELIFGSAVALIATVAAGIAHRHSPVHFVALKEALRPLAAIPGKAIADSIIVLFAVCQGKAGRFREINFDPGNQSSRSATRRALVVTGASVAPNSFVVRLNFEHHTLLLHEFVASPDIPQDEEWPL